MLWIKLPSVRKGADAEAFKADQETFDKFVKDSASRAAAKLEEARKEELDLIKKNWPDAEKTESGLMYIVRQEGDGNGSPKMGSTVTCHYEGTLLDGTLFDSSIKRGEPIDFQIGQVIQGWNEALMSMTKGEKEPSSSRPNLVTVKEVTPG